jgi:parallel beta helix pectate lyase-like protein/pentapeptide repeat protein
MEDQLVVATTAPAPSAGDASPSVKFKKDPRHHRATYGVTYPTAETKFKTKADLGRFSLEDGERPKLDEKKVYWELSGVTITNVVFRGCNFHTTHGLKASEVSSLTFERCAFNSCFFGFVLFRRTTFRGCTFNRCEMGRTEFEDCTFENCTFTNCTPWDAILLRTLLDPQCLLDGFDVPVESLRELVESERCKIEERHLRSRAALAEQLLRSNEERRNTLYSDRALFQNRRAALKLRRHEHKSKSWFRRIQGLPGIVLSAAYLHLTLGGTSLKRLFAIAAVTCLASTALLTSGAFATAVRGTSASSLSFAECLSAAISLFFAFGYTNISASGGAGNAAITVPPLLGMAWSAVVLAVIVRRAYR